MHIRINWDVPPSKFRHNLARLRKHLDLDQTDVAKLVGCSRIAIQSVERCRLALSKTLAAKLEGALGVTAEWLLLNDLKSPIPKPLRVYQEGNLPYKAQFGIADLLDHAISMLEGLKSESEFALFQHYTLEYINTLSKSFDVDYPAKGPFQSLKHLRSFLDGVEKQHAASLPQPRRKAKPARQPTRSQSRQ